MPALEQTYITPEQYLELERKAEGKSEYFSGRMFAMSGGSDAHSLIGGNVHALLWSQLRRGPCLAFNSDMKVRVSATGLYTYPDVSVVCGGVQYTDGQWDMMENPVVLVEVLSPTTEAYDRGEKFVHYQGLSSLTDYLIISQETMRVEQYVRQNDDQWLLSMHSGPEASVRLASIGCDLPLAEIYERVEVSAERNAPTLRIVNNSP